MMTAEIIVTKNLNTAAAQNRLLWLFQEAREKEIKSMHHRDTRAWKVLPMEILYPKREQPDGQKNNQGISSIY